MKRFDMEVRLDHSYYGEGEQYEVNPYETKDGDWVKWDDVQELLEALKEIRDVTDGRNNSVIGQDRAFSIARAAITKFEGTK